MGTGSRGLEEFLRLLLSHGVRRAVDVRRFPKSRFPHFCKDELERSLREQGIEYIWLGEQLGGYRKGGYEAWMKQNSFEEGLKLLMGLASSALTAFFCAERYPWRCHRRFIAKRLKEEGWEVIELI